MRLDFPATGQMQTGALSAAARRRIERGDGRPLFLADWVDAVFIHYEVAPELLQKVVPFELDLRDGRAYVSLVAFTMRRMRFAFAPRLSRWLLRPISEHEFLNVRTYVKAPNEMPNEAGIYFLAEWLSNPWSVPFGPPVFGLPYRFGQLSYQHGRERISGEVTAAGSSETLLYHAEIDPRAALYPCAAGSLDEFLMERYTAFTMWPTRRGRARFFRVWHEPWPQVSLPRISIYESTLLSAAGECFADAELIGANFSTGVRDVWMGWPHRLECKIMKTIAQPDLSIPQNTSAEILRRLRQIKITARISLGMVWLFEGLVPKIFFVGAHAEQIDLVRRSGLFWKTPETTLAILGVAQAVLALILFIGWCERAAVAVATAGMVVLIGLVACNHPALLTDPFGALIKDACLIACAATVWWLAPITTRQAD